MAILVSEFFQILLMSSPVLLLGLFIAGLLKSIIPQNAIAKRLRKPGLASVVTAAAFGVPLPLCSCSVIPVGVALRRQGASRGATASFFVSTPEIGVDSFLLSYRMLGGAFAILRAVTAFLSALIVGVLVELFCSEKNFTEGKVSGEQGSQSCCHEKSDASEITARGEQGFFPRLILGVRYGFGSLLEDLAVYLLLGFFLASIIAVFVPEGFITPERFSPLVQMLLMLLLSLPTYVCATASTPVAASLLIKGVAPGAVLVFLLAGPATNVTTIVALRGELGSRAAIIYVLGLMAVTFATAIIVQYYFPSIMSLQMATVHSAHEHFDLFHYLLTFLFTVLWVRALWVRLRVSKVR